MTVPLFPIIEQAERRCRSLGELLLNKNPRPLALKEHRGAASGVNGIINGKLYGCLIKMSLKTLQENWPMHAAGRVYCAALRVGNVRRKL